MNRQTLIFIALAVTIFYGLGFAAFDTGRAYAVLGAGLVTLSWIAVGTFGRAEPGSDVHAAAYRPRA